MLYQLRKLVPVLVSGALTFYVVARLDIADVATEMFAVSWSWVLGIMALLAGNMASVSWRLASLLRDFGAPQRFKTAFRANVSGLASSLFLISILGSVLGRQMVLQREGVSPALITVLTGYERAVLVVVGGGLALLGGLLLFGFSFLRDLNHAMPLWQIGPALGLAASLSVLQARRGKEIRLLAQSVSWRNLGKFSAVSGITLCAQAFAISTYVLAMIALGTNASPLQLLAGAAVVSFAASLPISVNGWGVRELAAIAVFGQLGASAHEAVAASVLVGLCSTTAVLVATPYALVDSFRGKEKIAPAGISKPCGPDHEEALARSVRSDQKMNHVLAILCGLGAAILLFFQIRLEISGNAVTANLADPIALSALAALAAFFLFQQKLPISLPRPFWFWLGGITLVLAFSFLNGVLQFGVTPWALSNRLFGWFVILGYVACGALIASQFGAHGRRILTTTLILSAAAVTSVSIFSDLIASAGFGRRIYLDGLSGFSGNRNTFALQIMLILAIGLAGAATLVRIQGTKTTALVGAILLLGIWQSGSKLGLGVTIILLLLAILSRKQIAGTVTLSILLAAVIYAVLGVTPEGLRWIVAASGLLTDQTALHTVNSMTRFIEPLHAKAFDERFISIRMGLDLWLSSPIFGSGLGAAIRLNLGENGLPLVIHSTPIWILAEFGLVGLAVVLSLPCYLLWKTRTKLWRTIRHRRLSPYHMGLLGICLVFGLFGLGHEIAYQRLFWLLIGAYAAQAITSGPADDRQTPPPA